MVFSTRYREYDGDGSLLRAEHVSYSWQNHAEPREALRDVTIEFTSGTPHFICGPSGAGKSTLGMVLAGLISPTRGQVKLDAADVAKQRERIAYLFQFPEAIFFTDSVRKEFEDICGGCGVQPERAFERVGVSFAEIEDRHPFALSEGYARLTALAMQFARQPEVLILDEPTIGLDWKHQERVIRALMEWLEKPKILVVITHDLDVLQEMQGRTWLVADGRLEWNGTTQDLLSDDLLLKKYALRA